LLKTYENLRTRLASLQQVAKKGVVDSSDLAIAQGDYRAISKSIHALSVEFKLFSEEQKKAMLSTAEQEALKARTAAVEAYTAAIQKNERVLKER
jgi:hypothetical protein